MSLTITGFIVIALGVWCQLGDPRRIVIVVMILTLFDAANAADLTALGGASMTPIKLFLAFFVLRLISMRNGAAAVVSELAPRRPLFLFLLLTVWVVASAALFPRLFADATLVYSLDRAKIEAGAISLQPSSGNITQSVAAIGSFVLALGMGTLGRRGGAYPAMLTGFVALTGLDIAFAVADLVTAATHTSFLLDPIHTASYAFLTSDESAGLKRISGSFSEASSFATFSLVLLAINASLFLSRVRPWTTGLSCLVLFMFLLLSTSSTAYLGLAGLLSAFGVAAIVVWMRKGDARYGKVFAAVVAVGTFLVCLTLLFFPALAESAWNVLDVSIFQKVASDSAIERGQLNAQGMAAFFDTYGFGAGLGSTRTSNYLVLLLSNIGLVGFLLFFALIGALTFAQPIATLGAAERPIVRAAKVGLLAALLPYVLVGAIFDLGPFVYILMGIVAGSTRRLVPGRADAGRGRRAVGMGRRLAA